LKVIYTEQLMSVMFRLTQQIHLLKAKILFLYFQLLGTCLLTLTLLGGFPWQYPTVTGWFWQEIQVTDGGHC